MLTVNEEDFEIHFKVTMSDLVIVHRDHIKEDMEFILSVEKPENIITELEKP